MNKFPKGRSKKTLWIAMLSVFFVSFGFITIAKLQTDKGYPLLKEGTYIPGHTISTWPSWPILGNFLGESLPTDPINELGQAGTCETNRSVRCVNDSQCGEGKCILHDPVTGWNATDLSFTCAPGSLAYRYYVMSGSYAIRTRFEDPGIQIDNLAPFVNSFQFNDPSRIFGLTTWNNEENPDGICLGNEVVSLGPGICGDYITNIANSEECDWAEGKYEAIKTACTNDVNDAGKALKITCTSKNDPADANKTPCMLEEEQVDCSALSVCGNGKQESGEFCDSGKSNGSYNKCDTDCKGMVDPFGVGTSPGFCGDAAVNPQYELCDTKVSTAGSQYDQVMNVKYALTMTDSCGSSCQSYGPFCGDKTVQNEFGEECESDKSCTFVDTTLPLNDPARNRPGVQKCEGCKLQACEDLYPIDPTKCGNGYDKDPYEACDDGLALNGKVCDPLYNQTCQWCSGDCRTLTTVPKDEFCGDGETNGPEKCDKGNSDINPTDPNGTLCPAEYNGSCKYCSAPDSSGNGGCQEVVLEGPKCGDGLVSKEFNETCDIKIHATDCTADYKSTCQYCSPTNCQYQTKLGGYCGDKVRNTSTSTPPGPEDCDKGIDPTQCSPAYGKTCSYCDPNCKLGTTIGLRCNDGVLTNPPENCEPSSPYNYPTTCSPGYGVPCDYCPSVSVGAITACKITWKDGLFCGDAVTSTEFGEQCDYGEDENGDTDCGAVYGETCKYCTTGCQIGSMAGPFCGDGVFQTLEFCEPNTTSTHDGKFYPASCAAPYNGNCEYCKVVDAKTCEIDSTEGHYCGDNSLENQLGPDGKPYEECEAGVNGYSATCSPTYGAYCPYCDMVTSDKKCTIQQYYGGRCGDGQVQQQEVTNAGTTGACDWGDETVTTTPNGTVCTPTIYGVACKYCETTCRFTSVPPVEYCGDGKMQVGFEQCDGDQACLFSGVDYGVKECASNCNWSNNGTCMKMNNVGIYTSQVKALSQTAKLDKITWTPTTTPAQTFITMKFRAGTSADLSSVAWKPVYNGTILSDSTLFSGDYTHVQYEATLSSNDPDQAPILDEVVITYHYGSVMAELNNHTTLAVLFELRDDFIRIR